MKTRYLDQELNALTTTFVTYFDFHVKILDIRLTDIEPDLADIDFVTVGIQVRQAFTKAPAIMAPGVHLCVHVSKYPENGTASPLVRVEVDYEPLTSDEYQAIKRKYRI